MRSVTRKLAPLNRSFSSCRSVRQDAPRPATAPKQVPDLKAIRENPELYSRNAVLRNYHKHEQAPAEILRLSERVSEINRQLKGPRRELKILEQQLAAARRAEKQNEANSVYQQVLSLRGQVDALVAEQDKAQAQATDLALALPNLTSHETPTDNEPKLIKYINYDPANPPTIVPGADHSSIGQTLSIIDFSSATTTSGWGFYYLLNEAAQLENALIQHATNIALQHGWQLCTPPSLVYSYMADRCGFQPRDASDEQQIWQIAQAEKDRDAGRPSRSLAATAEIPFAGLYADKTILEHQLPLKLVGASRCYRAEAGARGVDTKGLYRVHEFTKVEMFAWTMPDSSSNTSSDNSTSTNHAESNTNPSTTVFNQIVALQTQILSSLGLPLRILEMPTSDLGASAHRKIDIEALFPSRLSRAAGWGELTSVSMCTDYQSRRLGTRTLGRDGKVLTQWPWTVNGTAMAVPRVLACLLENGWDGSGVRLPEVLWGYMGGKRRIGPEK